MKKKMVAEITYNELMEQIHKLIEKYPELGHQKAIIRVGNEHAGYDSYVRGLLAISGETYIQSAYYLGKLVD